MSKKIDIRIKIENMHPEPVNIINPPLQTNFYFAYKNYTILLISVSKTAQYQVTN